MKAVIENLINYYKPVDEAKRSKEFFFSLADYVNHIKDTPELTKLIKQISTEKEKLIKERGRLEVISLQELETSKKELLQFIFSNKIDIESLNEEMQDLDLYEKGKILSSGVKSNNIDSYLWDMSSILFQNGYKENLKKFIEENPTVPNIYIDNKDFIFSSSIQNRKKVDERIVTLRKTELWGSWDYLSLIPLILLEHKKFHETVSKEDLDMAGVFIEISHIFRKRRIIKAEMSGDLPPQITPEEAREMSEFKLYASRIHNFLLGRLNIQLKEEKLQEPIELFKEPIIKDRTEEIYKGMAEATIRMEKRSQQDKYHRELMKQNRILSTREDKYTHTLNLIIERAEFTGDGNNLSIEYYYFNFESRMVDSRMLEKFLKELQDNNCFEKYTRTNYAGGTRFGFIAPNITKLKEFKLKRQADILPQKNEVMIQKKELEEFEIVIKDREFWVNDYLIAKPHAVGACFEFFEWIEDNGCNKELKREKLPITFKEQIKKRTFFHMLQGLGFKGSIKKAFFYKVSGDSLFFRGNKITKKDLKEAGVRTSIFIKELELAHLRNNPE